MISFDLEMVSVSYAKPFAAAVSTYHKQVEAKG
jgi:hypothetical protein